MSRQGSRLNDYLQHIQQAIERIDTYLADVQEPQFLSDRLLQDAVIRNLEILGEASRNILRDHPDFAKANERLPLRSAYEMRNVLAHGYFEVDIKRVAPNWIRSAARIFRQDQGFLRRAYLEVRTRRKPTIMA